MKALVYSFYFPPHGGPGAIRPLKMLKYASEQGLEGTVICAAEGDYNVRDDSLTVEIPASFEVLRTPERLDPLSFIRKRKPGAIHAPISDYFVLPDNKIWWIRPASKLGVMALPSADFVWATCPPYSAAMAARRAADALNLPLILDFRDSWTENPMRPKLPLPHRLVNRRLARKTIRRADLITGVNDAICDEIRRFAPKSPVACIPNGYAPEDFEGLDFAEKNDELTLFYLGTIYPDIRYPWPVLEAMAEVPGVRLRVAGRYPQRLTDDIARLGLGDRIDLLGFLPHREALQVGADSDISLLYIDPRPGGRGLTTCKAYEYIGLGNPILGFLPEGEAMDLLRDIPNAIIIAPEDKGAAMTSLIELKETFAANALVKHIPTGRYSRKNQAEEWFEMVREIVSSRKGEK
ncbi:MAG TPA: hypothetical protein ENN75_00405 [candidate division Zixibacteria bacterium]|nr:hypothetical protein [candidate division Zixibacteria bacterium]